MSYCLIVLFPDALNKEYMVLSAEVVVGAGEAVVAVGGGREGHGGVEHLVDLGGELRVERVAHGSDIGDGL